MVPGLAPLALADSSGPPSTAPADTQAVLRTALLQLSDRDPAVREAAREQLMGLPSSDLPALRTAVLQLKPLPPGNADALRDIVKQVYLSGENTEGDSRHGFMGISMNQFQMVYSDNDSDPDLPVGVIVEMRLPGFDAYRVLRDGDIILAIASDASGTLRIHEPQQIMDAVALLAAGQHVRLQVLRNGRRIETTLTLDPRPVELDTKQPAVNPNNYRKAQEDKAQAFWLARFAPLVANSIS